MKKRLTRLMSLLLVLILSVSMMAVSVFAEEPTEVPTTEAPTEAPTTEEPTTEAPTEAPTTEEPTTEAPTEAPTTEAPTEAPTTEEPTTEAPTEAPTTEAPTTEEPTTETPTTEAPTEPETPARKVIIKINDYGYSTFAEAIANAADGAELVLEDDIILTNPVKISADVYRKLVINLNGHKIRMYDARENMAGDMSGSNPDDYIGQGGMFILENGKITIIDKNAEDKGSIESSNEENPIFELIRDDVKGTYLFIEKGSYKVHEKQQNIIVLKDSVKNVLDASASTYDQGTKLAVAITGGSYNRALPESYIAEGYVLVDEGNNTWKVEKAPEPPTEEPTSEEPTSEEPTSEEPTSEEPTSEEPTSEEPTSEEPTSEEPTSEEPTSEEPTSEEPTSEEPTSEEPTTEEPTTEVHKIFVVTWQNYDGSLLEVDKVEEGQLPVYYGGTPKKVSDAAYRYEFAGWDKTITPVVGDTVYTAVYRAIPKEKTYIITWKNYDNTTIYSTEVREGSIPKYHGYTPYRPSDGKYSYVFIGWQQNITAAYADAVYTAAFKAIPITSQFTIYWQNYDGTVLEKDFLNNGELPVYHGKLPEKAADAKYTYKFAGWNKAIIPAEGDTTYVAQFKPVPVFEKAVMTLINQADGSINESYPILFEKGHNVIPYIEVSKAFEVLSSFFPKTEDETDKEFSVKYEKKGSDIIAIVQRVNDTEAVIDSADSSVAFSDYAEFSKIYFEAAENVPGMIQSLEDNKTYPEKPVEVKAELNKYGINVYEIDGALYMPLKTFSDLFMLPAGFSWTYADGCSFVIKGQPEESIIELLLDALKEKTEDNKETADAAEEETEKEKEAETKRSSETAAYEYSELCLVLDMNCGMKEDLGVKDGFDAYFKEIGLYKDLTGTDISKYEAALKDFSEKYLANVVKEEIISSYEEVNGTAYVTIGKFADAGLDLTDKDVTDNIVDYIAEDTRALIIYANRQIKRPESGIEKVVVDISKSSGYDLKSLVTVMSWLMGTADIDSLNVVSQVYSDEIYQADVDLDGKISEADSIADKEIFCLISSETREGGNILAGALKNSYAITLVGQTSGGGSHNILSADAGRNFILEFPGLTEFYMEKAASHISIAAGVDADYYLKDVTVFEDREKTESILNNIQ